MAFKIDEDKLRSALPVPTSTAGEDVKWSLAFMAIPLMALGFIGSVLYLIFR